MSVMADFDFHIPCICVCLQAGALLGCGIVNSGVRNECDPALALLSDYVMSTSVTMRIGAIFGYESVLLLRVLYLRSHFVVSNLSYSTLMFLTSAICSCSAGLG